jgi:stress response protein YsnF
MPDEDPVDRDVVVPVVQEQVHVDAVPVVTGGVRVTKHVETQNEVIEQQLRTSHADVKRVKTNRVVDGPQPAQRVGNTLIIPVVSEVIHVQKQWVVTEEIHITQREEVETVQETVPVNYESAQVERLDESGNATPATVPVERVQAVPSERAQAMPVERAQTPRSLVARAGTTGGATPTKPLSQRRSLLKDKGPQSGKR